MAILLTYDRFYQGRDDYDYSEIDGMISFDGGFNWNESFNVCSGEFQTLQPSLIYDDNRLLLFYLERHAYTDLRVLMKISNDDGKTWGEPVNITPPETGYHQLNNDRIIRLKNGRLLIPVTSCKSILPRTPDDPFVAYTFYSDDNMKTWRKGSGNVVVPPDGSDEPGVVELSDGRILMFIRTTNGFVYKSISYDSGDTWTEPTPIYNLPSSCAPATIKRIPRSGDLVVIWNNPNGSVSNYKRDILSAAISKNDGETWENIKTLEKNPDFSFAYPSIIFKDLYAIISYWSRDHVTISSAGTGLIDLKLKIVPYTWFYNKD